MRMKNHPQLTKADQAIRNSGARRSLLRRVLSAAALGTLLIAAFPALAADPVPLSINYQGKLTDGSGNLVGNGNYEIKFQIWSDETTGTLIWGKIYPVHIQDGYFNVILGAGGTAVAGATQTDLSQAFSESTRFLGLTVTRDLSGLVASQQEIAPRQQFLSAPYALRTLSAASADKLGSLGPGGYLQSAGGTVSGNVSVNGTFGVTGTSGLQGNTTVSADLTVSGGTFTVKSGSTEIFKVNSSGVQNGGLVPVGGIIMWSGSTVPSGWALCNGQNNTPDLRGKFVIGYNSSYALNGTGGASSVTLSVANMPAHTHSYTDYYFVDSGASTWKGGGAADANESTGKSGNYTGTTDSTGGGSSFSILPPYYALAYIMRTQ
jgi:microcystin-dependent protein